MLHSILYRSLFALNKNIFSYLPPNCHNSARCMRFFSFSLSATLPSTGVCILFSAKDQTVNISGFAAYNVSVQPLFSTAGPDHLGQTPWTYCQDPRYITWVATNKILVQNKRFHNSLGWWGLHNMADSGSRFLFADPSDSMVKLWGWWMTRPSQLWQKNLSAQEAHWDCQLSHMGFLW